MFRLEKRCELYHQWRKEAEQACAHMDDTGKHAWAMFNVRNHPDAKFRIRVPWRIVIQIACGIFLLLLGYHCHAQAITPVVSRNQIISPLDGSGNVKVNCIVGCTAGGGGSAITTWGGGTLGAMAAYGTSPGAVLVPGMNAFITNVPHMVCDSGCGGAASFSDNSAFTVGSTPVNVVAGYYTSGAAPALTSGNAARLRMDVNSYLLIDCVTGCFQTTQPVSGTFWQATQPVSGTVTANQGGTWTDRMVGATGATLDAATSQNVATPTNGLAVLCEFNTTPTTIATGNSSPCQLDSAGNLIVNLKTPLPAGTAVIGHVIVDSGAVNATLAAETTKVIGTVRLLGNAGATLDAAPAAALPANAQVIAGRDSTQTGGGTAVPVVCDKSAAITATAVGSVVVIALAASKTTYICGFVITGAGAAGTMQWKSGTGTTCGTGTANLTGAMATAIGGTVSYGTGFGTIMRHASAAQDTCITMATTSATASGVVSYAQF